MVLQSIEEQFDSFLEGSMSESERKAFEERLNSDAALKKEFELHQITVSGIKRKEVRSMFQEAELKSKPAPKRTNIIKLFSAVAVAACLMIGVFNYYQVRSKLYENGGNYIAQLEQPVAKGDAVTESLTYVYQYLQEGKCEEAQIEIDKIRVAIEEENKTMANYSEEEALYQQQMRSMISDDLDWCQALLYAQTHKVFKAKKLLEKISDSDSPYKEDARNILCYVR